ncbi:MAG: GGDEF domain-containing protein [Bradyrhizobiaceae bacterium]|nr:MAG: GGDEF domain-containing protein [Bradyrhizobiaceae bacterium]
MSQQGPIVVVSDRASVPFTDAIGEARLFPVIETGWSEAVQAVRRVQPAAVIVADTQHNDEPLAALARQAEVSQPNAVLIVLDPASALPPNAIPLSYVEKYPARFAARLNAALRVRTLHATVLRRMQGANLSSPTSPLHWPSNDPLEDANVLLIGRGGAYPSLSVALGERMGIVGALSIEAAAKHLNARDLDGIVIAGGFTARVVDAFLTVLSEDSRFRNLPVILTADGLMQNYDLPNLEIATGTPLEITANAIPLIRQNAFETRLRRALTSLDAGGLIDPATGLLTQEAFSRDFAKAVEDALARGAGLSLARFALPHTARRAQLDAARILSRLMRRMDFATLRDDDSIIVAFAETNLQNVRMIARRLASILRQTVISEKKDSKLDPDVTVATVLPNDSAASVLQRLETTSQRAAS